MVKRITVPLIILILLIASVVYARKMFSTSSSKDPNQYRVAAVKTDLVKKTVTATGVLKPWTTVDIKSKAGGRVDKLPVEEGSEVKKGQLIAKIDPTDTLLTYNEAKADIDANRYRVEETRNQLLLQKRQTEVALDTARANLASAKAQANAAKARYFSSQSQSDAQSNLTDASIENVKASLSAEQEKLDQMTSASHPQQYATAKANLRSAQANLKNAKAQLDRQQKLLEKGFVAQSQVDTAQATYDVAEANVANAQEKVDTIKPELDSDIKSQNARIRQMQAEVRTAEANRVEVSLRVQAALAAKADYDQAMANIKSSEAKLHEAEAGEINNGIREKQILQAQASGARAQAGLINAKSQLDQTQVAAPSDGVILKKYVEEGTLITSGVSFNSSGTSIVQMGDTTRMYVDVQVDETDVGGVEEKQKVDITFDAYNSTPFEGTVIKVDPQAVVDQNITTIHVRVEVDNSDAKYRILKPGMNATCEFIVKKKDDVICVPNEALKSDAENNHYVDVVVGGKVAPTDKDSEPDPNVLVEVKPKKTIVQIGLEGNDTTEITEGVKEGDKIVTQVIEPAVSGGSPFGGGGKGPAKK